MGTHLRFAAYTTPASTPRGVQHAFDDAIAEIRRIEALMTTWRPTARSRASTPPPARRPSPSSPETFDVDRGGAPRSGDLGGRLRHHVREPARPLEVRPGPRPAPADRRRDQARSSRSSTTATSSSTQPTRTVYPRQGRRAHQPRRHRQGLRRRSRRRRCSTTRGLTSFFVQAGGDLFTRGKKPDGDGVARRHPRSARRGRTILRAARA